MPHQRSGAAVAVLCLIALLSASTARAQDDRSDYPAWLARGTVELDIGGIRSPFSGSHLEDGYEPGSVEVPHLAVRLSLGHRLTGDLSLHVNYLRPARWVRYIAVNGDARSHSVWTNVAAISVRQRVPIDGALAVYGEGGIGIITRHGFEIGGVPVMEDLVYATPLLRAGAERRVSNEWALQASATFLPGKSGGQQPHTSFMSAGLAYRVQPRPPAPAASTEDAVFHEHLVQAGWATHALGNGFSTMMSPIFWEGDVRITTGFSADYLRNVFHTRKLFSIDLGGNVAYGRSLERKDNFVTVSVFPVLRLTVLRTSGADFYFNYSLAGPTFISKFIIDGHETGRHFTLRDAVGLGAYMGRGKHLNAELRIAHFSNGNLLPQNTGIQVPLTLTIGYAF